ncbi:MAG: acyl carrier protein [Chloroflexota bacterium]|nr:acyl carrier protein [Chloroflexota bacterium]
MVRRETVLSDVIAILEELLGDWDFQGEIREDSSILEELGLESIDAVALGSEIEEKYGRSLPFAQFLVDLREQEQSDFTVGQLVDFVTRALKAEEIGAAHR